MQKAITMLTREQILEVETYCAEHQISQSQYLEEHNIPVTNTTCGKGSIVRKTNNHQNLVHLSSCVLAVSLSHQ